MGDRRLEYLFLWVVLPWTYRCLCVRRSVFTTEYLIEWWTRNASLPPPSQGGLSAQAVNNSAAVILTLLKDAPNIFADFLGPKYWFGNSARCF